MKIDLNKIPESNVEWAAQQITLNMQSRDKTEVKRVLKKLNECLYKSWAKDLTLNELMEVVELL